MCRSAKANGEEPEHSNGATKGKVQRVVLWGPPRSLSTAVERALVEHPAIAVMHEPFGTPHYWSSEAASSREGSDSTLSRATFASVAEQIFRADPPPGKQHIFSKNLSYYFAPHCLPNMSAMLENDYSRVVHSFIIRHPAKAVSSLYYKSCIDNEKTGYTHFDPAEAGFTAMWAILQHVEKQPDCPPIVIIDADDLLYDPEGIMTAYCEQVGLPFNLSMLSWTPGPVKELESPWTGWTDDVLASSGITRRSKISPAPNTDSLPQEVRDTIAEAMPIYDSMFERRIRPRNAPEPPPKVKQTAATTSSPARTSSMSYLGVFLMLMSVCIWVFNAVLIKAIQTDGWNKPYFQAIMLKGLWAFTLPVWYLLSTIQSAMQEEITFRRPLKPSARVVGLSMILMLLVVGASVTFIASLALTAVSVNTAIYNVNPLLAYLFSIPILGEKPSLTRGVAVLLALCGTTIVAKGNKEEDARGGVGVVIVALSATIYSLKEVLFKRFFPSVSVSLTPFTDSLLVVGIIGVCASVILAPSVVVLHVSGVESFELPSVDLAKSYALLACSMSIYQACLLAAIALTSPTFVAMGTMLAVPASIVFDYSETGYFVPPLARYGIVAIIAAFGMLFFSGAIDSACSALSLRACCRTSEGGAVRAKAGAPADLV